MIYIFEQSSNNRMTTQSKTKDIEIQSTNCSLKLLTTLGSTGTFATTQFKRITNLQGLSKRLKEVNTKHATEHKPNDKEITKEWINEEGINFAQTYDLVQETRNQKIISKNKKIALSWNSIEYELFKDVSFDQLTLKSQERLAYSSVALSLNGCKQKNQHMKRAVGNALSKLSERSDNIPKDIGNQKLFTQKQLIKNFGEIIQEGVELDEEDVVGQLHSRLSKCFGAESIWIDLLSSQIQMAKYLSEAGQKVQDFTNYIYIVSLKALQNYYESFFKSARLQRDEFLQATYNHGLSNSDKYWANFYFYLRMGKHQKCKTILQNERNLSEYVDNYIELVNQINQFKQIDISYQTDRNSKDNLFEAIIKQIYKGKEDGAINMLKKYSKTLDQPWFILLVFAIKRANCDNASKRQLRRCIQGYFESKIGQTSLEESKALLVGLMSLGAYDLVFQLYNQCTKRKNCLILTIDFIHIFILLASNPNLLQFLAPQTKRKTRNYPQTAWKIIQDCLRQIIKYVKDLSKNNPTKFKSYVQLLLEIITNLQIKCQNIYLDTIIADLCKHLFPTVHSVKQLYSSKLYSNNNSGDISKKFFAQLMRNIRYDTQSEFFELAQFCKSQDRNDLAQHILVRLIIKLYMLEENIEEDIPAKALLSVNSDGFTVQQYAEKAERELTDIISSNGKKLIHFIKDLKSLRKLLQQRKKDEIVRMKKGFQRFRENRENILNYLQDMSRIDGHSYLDIFVSYYQKLQKMYQIYFIERSMISSLRQINRQLIDQLQISKRRYPSLNSQFYGRILTEFAK